MVLLEDQYGINDVVRIGSISGLVEHISLRTTVLRNLEGVVHFIPHGTITTVSNLTHGWSRALFDIGVAYKEDVDRVMQVLLDLGNELRQDATFGPLILDNPEMLGVDGLADSSVVLKFFMKTLPLQQWTVKREMLRRIKNKFDALGIEIPYPHQTVYHRYETPPPAGAEQLPYAPLPGKRGMTSRLRTSRSHTLGVGARRSIILWVDGMTWRDPASLERPRWNDHHDGVALASPGARLSANEMRLRLLQGLLPAHARHPRPVGPASPKPCWARCVLVGRAAPAPLTDHPYPTLVPARNDFGHCHWYFEGRCAVHENAPYSCAFFDAHLSDEEVNRRAAATIQACKDDATANGLYHRVWLHLRRRGLIGKRGDRAALIAEVQSISRQSERNRRRA